MKQITVISGKGGTGKTTIVASLATLVKKAVLADADVDAADLYLLLKPQIQRREPFFASKVAQIDPHHCDGCQKCREVCRHFRVPAWVCVNKADINPENTERIREFCQQEGTPVIGEIPFDPIVTKAMVYASTVVEYSGGKVSNEIKKMWMRLERSLGFPLDGIRSISDEKTLNP
ncbi:MAG: hypothetical protein FJ117_15100 [Deltaproteobacteria bacterium]|nr:hypothetical protein [Deltaproteobacteria bacterium]